MEGAPIGYPTNPGGKLENSADANDRAGLVEIATALRKIRHARSAIPPADVLFHDPAWDILIDLYIAYNMKKCVSVKSASMASRVPTTTALRHLWHLESLALLERRADPTDKRRFFIQLTEAGLNLVEQILGDYKSFFGRLFTEQPVI